MIDDTYNANPESVRAAIAVLARAEGTRILVLGDMGELGAAGDYTIAYRVTSADGHPVSGTVPFTLTEAGSGTPASTVAATADDGGIPVWPFVVGAVVVLGGGLAMVLRGGRRAGRA